MSARKRAAIERLREIKAANGGQLPRPALQSLQPMSDERKILPLRLADPDDAGSLRHARALCEHALTLVKTDAEREEIEANLAWVEHHLKRLGSRADETAGEDR